MDLFECESIFTIPFAISHLAQKSRKRDKGGTVRRRKEAMNGEMGREEQTYLARFASSFPFTSYGLKVLFGLEISRDFFCGVGGRFVG